MSELTKKEKDLIRLAKLGGNDATLMLLDKISELEEKLAFVESHTVDSDTASLIKNNISLLGSKIKSDKELEEVVSKLATRLALKIAVMEKGEPGEPGKNPTDEELRALIIPLIPAPINGLDGKDADEEAIIEGVLSRIRLPEYKEAVLDTPEQLRDKLEILKDDNRLDKSAIKGLEDDIKALDEKISSVSMRRGGGSGPNANAMQAHYFTGDGTKSYNVPRHRVALMLIGTEAPLMFKKTTDWTTANTTLTLNASLNDTVGQEFVFLYLK